MLFVQLAIVFVSLILKVFQILLLILEPQIVNLLMFKSKQFLPLFDGSNSFIILVQAFPQLFCSLFFLASYVVKPIQKHLVLLGFLLRLGSKVINSGFLFLLLSLADVSLLYKIFLPCSITLIGLYFS